MRRPRIFSLLYSDRLRRGSRREDGVDFAGMEIYRYICQFAGFNLLQTPTTQSIQTLPRLLAINKSFANLDEQIGQATNIIGLPEDWDVIDEEKEHSRIIPRLVRARAEWVLRWILEKLKDEADTGVQARANRKSWKLIDWMVHVVPTPRSASLLRDADLLSVLEKTLQENFQSDNTIQPIPAPHEAHSRELSESSETMQEDPKPSRKRKQPSSGTSTPSKRAALQFVERERLFQGIIGVVKSISIKANAHGNDEEAVHTEHMKMVLRTECAQAARVLKLWLTAMNNLLAASERADGHSIGLDLDTILPLISDIWELRIVDLRDDSGASAEQFSTECLIPLLILHTRLQLQVDETTFVRNAERQAHSAIQYLEKLLARHLFVPSRAAFFGELAAGPTDQTKGKLPEAKYLASNLEPLRAKILQAAQILDSSERLPGLFRMLFKSISHLLDIAIKISPSRTPKNRITEQPWIQAVFIALCQCAGCSLEPPEFPIPRESISALTDLAGVLTLHNIRIDSRIVGDMFWYHTGIQFPVNNEDRIIWWSLITALVDLDSDAFLPSNSPQSSISDKRPSDLAEHLFNFLSSGKPGFFESAIWEHMEIADREPQSPDGIREKPSALESMAVRDAVLEKIIIPIMTSFSRNRDLLGFIRKWDNQLCAKAPIEREALEELGPCIWEDRRLSLKLAELFEQCLTHSQMSSLFQHHLSRLKPLRRTKDNPSSELTDIERESVKRAYSSTILLGAMLGSIESDEAIETIEPHLLVLFTSFSSLVRKEGYRIHTDLASCYNALCRLLTILWPLQLHSSSDSQKKLLLPIVEQASHDISTARKHKKTSALESKTRAGALLCLLTCCDHLRTAPGWDDVIRESIRKSIKYFGLGYIGFEGGNEILEIFCSEFVPLLEYLEPERRERYLGVLLSQISKLDSEIVHVAADSLSQNIFSSASPAIRRAYSAALLDTITETRELEQEELQSIAQVSFSKIRPSAMFREHREAVLDKLTSILVSNTRESDFYLSVMVSLQRVPNASAKISVNGSSLFDIAESLHDSKSESDSVIQFLQHLVQLTLDHILLNKNQPQNKEYLETFRSKLKSICKKPNRCYPSRFAILRAVFLVQRQYELLPWGRYSTLLDACLISQSGPHILDAFNEIPRELLEANSDMFDMLQASLRNWLDSNGVDLGQKLSSNAPIFDQTQPTEVWLRLHTLLAKFKLYQHPRLFLDLSRRMLQELAQVEDCKIHQDTILESVRNVFAPFAAGEKLDMIRLLDQVTNDDGDAPFRLLHTLISTLDDTLDDDVERRKQQLSLLPMVCTFLSNSQTISAFAALVDSICTILSDKPSFTSQHSIESVITTLVKLTSRHSPSLPSLYAPTIYARLCETARLILLLHRGRLGGRFHLLLPLLQNLLFVLFMPNAGQSSSLPPWLKSSFPSEQTRLTPQNAAQYMRLLSTLCSPTQSSVAKAHNRSNASSNTKSTLNDQVKAAREYASHFIYPLLSCFCRFQLSGRLLPEVREKLTPGIWEALEVASMDREALDAMFAGLDANSKDVWRGVWEEYSKAHGRGSQSS